MATHIVEPRRFPMSVNYVQAAIDGLMAELPDLDADLARYYALLVLTAGTTTSLEDVHEAWGLWRDLSNPAHKSLIPFDELTVEVQEYDRPYRDAIRKVAAAQVLASS